MNLIPGNTDVERPRPFFSLVRSGAWSRSQAADSLPVIAASTAGFHLKALSTSRSQM